VNTVLTGDKTKKKKNQGAYKNYHKVSRLFAFLKKMTLEVTSNKYYRYSFIKE